MKTDQLPLFVVISTCILGVYSANILSIVPTPSYSHQVALWPIWEALSIKGHNVTLITADPRPNLTNITQIDVSFTYKKMAIFAKEAFQADISIFEMLHQFKRLSETMEDDALSYPKVKELIHNKDLKFDVVMVEIFYEVSFLFARKFDAPLIGVCSMDVNANNHECFGNPTHPFLYPEEPVPVVDNPTIIDKLWAILLTLYWRYENYLMDLRKDKMVEKHFGLNYPKVQDFICDPDMIFINTSPVRNILRPLVPGVVSIGGALHIDKPKLLPKDLQDFLDSAPQGVIYFSLGSNVKSKDLTDNEKSVIMNTLTELPYKVLWKFEADELPGKPNNVKLIKWAPQQDILRHKNIKLFVTQGGLQSIDEAIFNHVPMVVMPFFGDQPNNAKKIVSKGIAQEVDHFNLKKESFKATILEVITNPKYKETITRLSKLALDQPMTGVEKAVWWTEYVIRHKGAQHLKSQAANVPLYQYLMLDVIGFILLVLSIVFFILYKMIKLVFCLVCRVFCKSSSKKVKTK